MKTKFTLGCFVFLFVLFKTHAQEVQVPLKNGMIYYMFLNKLNNTKKCLEKYCDVVSMKMMDKTAEFQSKLNNSFTSDKYALESPFPELNGFGGCNDTLGTALILSLPTNFVVTYLYDIKKKPMDQSVTANLEIIFVDTSEYILKLKGFTYLASVKNGFNMEMVEYPLDKIYHDYLENPTKSKDLKNLFSDVNMIIQELNRLIQESFVEAYTVDELD
jgi:hypothetical protein